jgi:hypothetical protein
MRRWLAVAALGAAFLAVPAWGQRRGGASGGFAGHTGFGARGPVMMNRSPGFAGVQRGSVHFGNSFNRPFHSPFFFHGHRYSHRSWPYAGYPYYGYPWFYGNDSYSSDSYQSYPPSDYYGPDVDNNREQAEIDRLENEVDRLREEREARESSGSRPRSNADLQPTQLVFRDRHTEEVQNYAIVGQTFWVFTEQRTKKIPLSSLDIPATKRANDDRGVDFQLPE